MRNYPKAVNSNEKQGYKEVKPYESLGLGNQENSNLK